MSAIVEQQPDYAKAVATYLKRYGLGRRLPWGSLVSSGGLTWKSSTGDRAKRAELGETAIALLSALGVSAAQLEALDAMMPIVGEVPAEELLAALEALQTNAMPAALSATMPEPEKPAPAAVPAGLAQLFAGLPASGAASGGGSGAPPMPTLGGK